MSIVDLRQSSSRQIAPLLDEETQRWREELHWDYRGSLDLIKKFVDAKSLAGGVAMEDGQVAGYSFYVLEEHKALLGGLYVSSRWPQLPLAVELLDYTLADAARPAPHRTHRSAADPFRLRPHAHPGRARLSPVPAPFHAAGFASARRRRRGERQARLPPSGRRPSPACAWSAGTTATSPPARV